MKILNLLLSICIYLFCFCKLIAQDFSEVVGGQYSSLNNSEANPCFTKIQYDQLEYRCNINCTRLDIVPSSIKNRNEQILLNWPLRSSLDLKDCDYYFTSAHVDHDPSASLFKDYNCGNITYNGHRGTDIGIWPYPFYKMDNDLVEVVAAASGVIIDKHDGEYDKNCVGVGSGLTPNYIVIQHSDGSRALYLHMKKNSLTTKLVGDSIDVGEYLGVVGSSGSSSGPHLHFEVWAGSTVSTLIDPFAGNCNSLNDSSWWSVQKPYTEPSILKASVHITDVILPPCPETETINESTIYEIPFQGPGLAPGYAKFYIFLRNETAGTVVNMRILNPDSTIFNSWTHDCANNYNATYWGYSKKLPLLEGDYAFQAIYNGDTCTQNFKILTITLTNGIIDKSKITIFPNPASNQINLNVNKDLINATIDIFNSNGSLVKRIDNINGVSIQINSSEIPNGLYLMLLHEYGILKGSLAFVISK